MTLPVYSFDQTVTNQQNIMQSVAGVPLDFNAGSVFLALVEANAGNFMWLQAIATSLLASTRLSTSSGNDVDTFIQDFGFSRYQGSASSGDVTFSRPTTGIQGIIPVGTTVSVSTINNLNFIVGTPSQGSGSYPNYDATTNSYIIASNQLSCLAPVICQQNGTIGNVSIGQINTINQSLVGVPTVSNALAYTNGINAWSDAVTKQEFVLYIQSLARATQAAINYAISIVSPKPVRWITIENEDESGNTQYGFFYAVVDFGNGAASSQQLANTRASIELYRGFTIQYDVIAPTPITANIIVNLVLVPTPTETQAQITTNVQNALITYIQGMQFMQTLYISRVVDVIYNADPNILDVIVYPTTNYLTINGLAEDLIAPLPKNVIIPGTITVNYIN